MTGHFFRVKMTVKGTMLMTKNLYISKRTNILLKIAMPFLALLLLSLLIYSLLGSCSYSEIASLLEKCLGAAVLVGISAITLNYYDYLKE